MAISASFNKIHIIVNPLSARGKTQERWKSIKELIHHYFKEFKYIFTEKPKQATEITRDLLKEGFDLIVGVGGDGILNEITNGFYRNDRKNLINEDASLGIIPSGTGSDFIRYLKIPRDFKQSVELIKNSTTKKIDIGKITFLNSKGGDHEVNHFVNVADFGLGAEVIKNLNAVPALKRNLFCYYKGLLTTIKNYKSKKVKIIVDDGELDLSKRVLIGAVANGGIFGGGMIIAPDAQLDDGYFDLVLVEEMKRFEVIRNSWRLYNGTLNLHPKVTVKRAKKIRITSEEEVNIEYDGEMGATLPAEFEIVEKGLNFRV
jgi:YegS/Rv2252/BmrU family lipid kinase